MAITSRTLCLAEVNSFKVVYTFADPKGGGRSTGQIRVDARDGPAARVSATKEIKRNRGAGFSFSITSVIALPPKPKV
jgi:hypothetical protein